MNRRRFLAVGVAAAAVGVVGACSRDDPADPPTPPPFPEIAGLTPGLGSMPVARVADLHLHRDSYTHLVDGWWVVAAVAADGTEHMAALSVSDPHATPVLADLTTAPRSGVAIQRPNHGPAVTVTAKEDDGRTIRATTWPVTAAHGVGTPTDATTILDQDVGAPPVCRGGDVFLMTGLPGPATIFDGSTWKVVDPPTGVPPDAVCVNTANGAADQFWASESRYAAWIVRGGAVIPVEVGFSEPDDLSSEADASYFGSEAVYAGDSGWLVSYSTGNATAGAMMMLVLTDGTRADDQPDEIPLPPAVGTCDRSITSSGEPGRYLIFGDVVVDLAQPRVMTSDELAHSIVDDTVYGGVPTASEGERRGTPASLMSIPQTGTALQVDDPGEQSWRTAESVGPEFALVTQETPAADNTGDLYVVRRAT